MRRSCLFALVPGALVVVLATFVVALLLLKLLWAWTVPDLAPGAVEQGLMAASISWFTAFKLAIFVAVLAGIGGAHRSRHP
jgi:uncharacterized membrane protein YkvI